MRLAASLALAAVLSLAGCRQESGGADPPAPSSRPDPEEILLPGNALPSDLVRTEDGRLWVAQARISAIAEIDPSGKITQHRVPGSSTDPPFLNDLQESPDGGIWYSGSSQLGRLDPSGRFTWWSDDAGYPEGLTLGPDDTVWYAHTAGGVPAVSRADEERGLSGIATLRAGFAVPAGGITTGPDGAVWFSQVHRYDGPEQDGIGRLTAQGAYREWALPKGTNPHRIVAGPDEALWFTERGGIGRIGLDGAFSHFAIEESEHPDGIALGRDEALWFTTDNRVGRITPQGRITLWPVRGAEKLTSIVPSPEGGFWLADQGTHSVRRFSPPR